VNRCLVPPGPNHPRPLLASPLGWWSGGGSGGSGPGCRFRGRVRLSPRMHIYFACSPTSQQCDDGQLVRQTLPGTVLSTTFDIFSPIQKRVISPGARWQQSASTAISFTSLLWRRVPILRVPILRVPSLPRRGFWVREGNPSAAISGVPLRPPLPQDAHDPQCGGAGKSQADAILIPSGDESDDFDGRSDTSFGSLDGLQPDSRNKVRSGRVTGTGMCLDPEFLGRPNMLTCLSRQRCRRCFRR
jgi:hypothetical protein